MNASQSFKGKVTRTSAEFQALNKMKHSLLGLKKALSQRGVVVGRASFSNEVLARLQVILDKLGARGALELLVDNSDFLHKTWYAYQQLAQKKAATADKTRKYVQPSWTKSYAIWKDYDVAEKLLAVAMCPEKELAEFNVESLLDNWRNRTVKKSKKTRGSFDDEGYTTVGWKSTNNATASGAVASTAAAALPLGPDRDFDEDALLNRQLEEDDDADVNFDWWENDTSGLNENDDWTLRGLAPWDKERYLMRKITQREVNIGDMEMSLSQDELSILKSSFDPWDLVAADRQRLSAI